MRGDWQIFVGRFGSKLNDVGALAEQRESLLGPPDRYGKDVRKHDALEAHPANDRGNMEKAVAEHNFGRLIDIKNSVEAGRHNAPAPNGGNSATLSNSVGFMDAGLTSINASSLPLDSTGMVA